MDKLDQIFTNFIGNFRNVYREAKKQGFWGILKLFWRDLFAGQTTFQWVYTVNSLVGLVPMDQSPQEGGGLDGKSLDSSRNDRERVF